jgi:hypothetical protein
MGSQCAAQVQGYLYSKSLIMLVESIFVYKTRLADIQLFCRVCLFYSDTFVKRRARDLLSAALAAALILKENWASEKKEEGRGEGTFHFPSWMWRLPKNCAIKIKSWQNKIKQKQNVFA